MAETGLGLSWPVRWEQAVRQVVEGQDPNVLLDDPRLAAHRVLDRLAALSHDVHDGVPAAQAAFVDAVDDLVDGAPWLVAAAQRRMSSAPEPDPARGDYGSLGPGAGPARRPAPEKALVDEEGVWALVATAIASVGWSAASVILELAATATAAERWFGGDDPNRDDIAQLGGVATAALDRWALARGQADGADPGLLARVPAWERLNALTASAPDFAEEHRCAKLLDDSMHAQEVLRPEPTGPLTWVTGIQAVDVSNGCSASPTLTIRGSGFGSTQPSSVGVVVPTWDPRLNLVTHQQVGVTSWADRQVVVRLGDNAVGGIVAFANTDYLAEYDEWNQRSSEIVAELMRNGNCPGFDPLPRPLWPLLSLNPPVGATVSYQVAAPRILVEVTGDPLGTPATRWRGAHAQVQSGSAFWIVWRSINADDAALRPVDATGSQVLQGSGQPAAGVGGLAGKVRLVAPQQAAVLQFAVEAHNNECGTVRTPLRIVVTGPPIGPVKVTVLQALPGGDVDVVSSSGVEGFAPAGGRSIALVAEKRTVVRIDWWPAIPQVPEGERISAVCTLHVDNFEAWPQMSGPLSAGESTAEGPWPTGFFSQPGGPPFSSLPQYEQWVTAGNEPATFNVVMPAEWCMYQAILEPKIRVFTPGPTWDVRTALWVKFHRRRRVRIRYRRYTNPVSQLTATTEEAVAAIRRAASMLPIPDPEIVVLGNDPAAPSAGYIEDMIVERGSTPTISWRDEIWLVIGPPGDGGVADASTWPWTAAAGATDEIVAHEVGHLFGQPHIALCGAAQNPEQPSTFPDMGNVVPIGWHLWANRSVRRAIDVMSYCTNRWISPERWRRIFLQLGPPT
jgi:hypothetical protein